MISSISRRVVAAAGMAILAMGLSVAPAFADDEDDPPISQAPGPGEPTTQLIEFSVPMSFDDAIDEAGA